MHRARVLADVVAGVDVDVDDDRVIGAARDIGVRPSVVCREEQGARRGRQKSSKVVKSRQMSDRMQKSNQSLDRLTHHWTLMYVVILLNCDKHI